MTNNQLLKKLSEDMKMRNFSHYTYDSYMGKTKDMIRYFNKPIEEVTMEELRYFLYQHLLIERKLSDRSINYYNSVIRFVSEVTLDKVLNKKQLPMRKRKRAVYKVLTREELGSFFNCVDDFKYKTIFMFAYGAGLRIGEIANLRVEDIDSKIMRIFVREGKGNKERYAILPEETLKMLRIYWSKYRQNRRRGRIFLSESGAAITVGVMREHFRKYRRKAKLKLPQFTTMNAIDGQAGLIIYTSLIFYSLTLDNILNKTQTAVNKYKQVQEDEQKNLNDIYSKIMIATNDSRK